MCVVYVGVYIIKANKHKRRKDLKRRFAQRTPEWQKKIFFSRKMCNHTINQGST